MAIHGECGLSTGVRPPRSETSYRYALHQPNEQAIGLELGDLSWQMAVARKAPVEFVVSGSRKRVMSASGLHIKGEVIALHT